MITIQTEAGGSYADADEETLDRLVSQIGEHNSYLIVERSDRDGSYAQAALERRPDGAFAGPGRYVVEYRDGPNRHFQAHTVDIDAVREVLAGWALDRPGWKAEVDWKVLDLGF